MHLEQKALPSRGVAGIGIGVRVTCLALVRVERKLAVEFVVNPLHQGDSPVVHPPFELLRELFVPDSTVGLRKRSLDSADLHEKRGGNTTVRGSIRVRLKKRTRRCCRFSSHGGTHWPRSTGPCPKAGGLGEQRWVVDLWQAKVRCGSPLGC